MAEIRASTEPTCVQILHQPPTLSNSRTVRFFRPGAAGVKRYHYPDGDSGGPCRPVRARANGRSFKEEQPEPRLRGQDLIGRHDAALLCSGLATCDHLPSPHPQAGLERPEQNSVASVSKGTPGPAFEWLPNRTAVHEEGGVRLHHPVAGEVQARAATSFHGWHAGRAGRAGRTSLRPLSNFRLAQCTVAIWPPGLSVWQGSGGLDETGAGR